MKVSYKEERGASGVSWARTRMAREEAERTKERVKGGWRVSHVIAFFDVVS